MNPRSKSSPRLARWLSCALLLLATLAPAQEPAEGSRSVALPRKLQKLAQQSPKTAAPTDPPARSADAAGDRDAPRAQIRATKTGAWGTLEYFTTYLEVPLDLLKDMEVSSLSLEWRFPGEREDDVEKLLRSLELPAAIRAELLDRSKWRRDDTSVIVTPSPATTEALPAAARATIYGVLARFAENRFHFEPKVVPGGSVHGWLRDSIARTDLLATIEKTLYRRGQTTLFSDDALILRMAGSDAERLQLRKALSRTPTLVAKLRLGSQASAPKLAEYWSAGRRFKAIEPFLESMIETEGVERIDLVHLLPASVRKLLYTFPNETHGRSGYYPDCHWTSLNFFNYEPLERLAEPPLATAYTLENFVQVPKAERLGDVLFFMNEKTGDAYHSCAFIADDIVFTKNGRSRTSPWVLMKLADVRELYAIHQQTSVVYYRLKPRP